MMKSNCCPAKSPILSSSPENQKQEQLLAEKAKALAHPARIRILSVLSQLGSQNDCLNSDLVSELDLAQSTISEHIRILKQAGFISAEPRPPKVCYRIEQAELDNFKHLFSLILGPR